MDVHRQSINPFPSTSAGEPLNLKSHKLSHYKSSPSDPHSLSFRPLYRWREKIRTSTPLHVVTLSEIAAILSFIASVIYLINFFGIGFIHPITSRTSTNDELELDDDVDAIIAKDDNRNPGPCPAGVIDCSVVSSPPPQQAHKVSVPPKIFDNLTIPLSQDDEEIVKSVISGSIPSYSLESTLGDCRRAAVAGPRLSRPPF